MSVRSLASEHYRHRRRLTRGVEALAARLWRRVDRARIADSWALLAPQLLAVLVGAQREAAGAADGYLAAVLAAQGIDAAADGRLAVDALAGVASDGRDLGVLLNQPVLTALTGLSRGRRPSLALASGEAAVRMIAATQVADAGRVADQVALTARPAVQGYRRMLVGKSCSRCVVLAGKWFRYNRGFARHPKCDCIHVPAAEDTAASISTDPRKYFESLSREDQDRVFTKAGAESIRLDADVSQVVNARRGARGLTTAGARVTGPEARILRGGRGRGRLEAVDVYGRQLYVTTEGVTVRGHAGIALGARRDGARQASSRYRSSRTPRLMPESILAVAKDREDAIRLLRQFGYFL